MKACLHCQNLFKPITNQKYCKGCGSYNYKLKQQRARKRKRELGCCDQCGIPTTGYRCPECQLLHQVHGWKYSGIIGATTELYHILLQHQGGVCAICHKPPTTTLCLDHHHPSGTPRSLICTGCNAAIGAVEKLLLQFGSIDPLLEYLKSDSRFLLDKTHNL